eukprot:231766-Prymnesium_polylepis.1
MAAGGPVIDTLHELRAVFLYFRPQLHALATAGEELVEEVLDRLWHMSRAAPSAWPASLAGRSAQAHGPSRAASCVRR